MDEKTRLVLLIAAIAVIVAAIVFLSNPLKPSNTVYPQNSQPKAVSADESKYPLAPEIIGIKDWINSKPLSLADLKGKVVLVDFWTYSSINCIRTLPYLESWHKKYSGMGFVLVGVHSPEFEFEKKLENVEIAVKDNGLTYPVALDSGMETWRNYKNRFWPAKYLIDSQGHIRYTHFGEGAYEETEELIQELLEEASSQKIDVELTQETGRNNPAGIFRTRELYAGYFRAGYIGNSELLVPGQANEFVDPKNHLDGLIYLNGLWFNSSEFVRHVRTTQNLEDFVAINFLAQEVNIVVGAGTESYKVFVTVDGKNVEEILWGKDIQVDSNGNTFVEVKENKLYSIINGPVGKRELKISSDSGEFKLYTFTFG